MLGGHKGSRLSVHVFVLTNESKAAAAVRIGAGTARRERGRLLESLRPCFARTQVWLQAGKYISALMSEVPERNGWAIARHCGDRTPDKTQRLLNHARWDTRAAMSVVRRFAAAGLDEAARRNRRQRGMRVGALDETGQEKQGSATAGVPHSASHLRRRHLWDDLNTSDPVLTGPACRTP